MNENTPVTQPVENGANTQPVENGTPAAEKMFTQSELNEIIRIRLERERAKNKPSEPTEEETKQKELAARESRVSCKEFLLDSGYSMEFLEIFDTSDLDTFKDKCLTVVGMIRKAEGSDPSYDPSYGLAGGPDAFARTTTHTPRQYGIFYGD